MTDIVVTPTMPTVVTVPQFVPAVVTVPSQEQVNVYPGNPGPPGEPGPPGPSGTTVVAVPYDEWPPVETHPNTLYLRLAP